MYCSRVLERPDIKQLYNTTFQSILLKTKSFKKNCLKAEVSVVLQRSRLPRELDGSASPGKWQGWRKGFPVEGMLT